MPRLRWRPASNVPERQSSDDDKRFGCSPWRPIVWLATLTSLAGAVLTLTAFAARWNTFCDLTTHWPVQIATVTTLACLVHLAARQPKLALLAGTIALLNASYVAPLFIAERRGHATTPVCRAVSANVRTSNRDSQQFLRFIRSAKPDFILVMEVDDRWLRTLADLKGRYPHSIARPRPDNFGILFLSRHLILSHRVESLADSGVPTIIATIEFDGRPLTIVGTHPLPPVGRQNSGLRDRHLHAIGELVSQLPTPMIVLGDLNTTSWSPRFLDLIQQTNLRDSRRGFGVQPTWPSESWILRIPIDHALVSQDLIVTERFVGPNIGSDHFPIVVTFAARQR